MLVGSDGPRGFKTRDLPRVARWTCRRLRRALQAHSIATALLIVTSLVVVSAALTGPPSRATVFRTDPVLRAMGLPYEEPESELAALAAVPSLSVSPRFVLPMLRDEGKRILAALPLARSSFPKPPNSRPLEPPSSDAAPPVALTAVEPSAGAADRAPTAARQQRGPPRLSLKPRGVTPPLTTAVVMTPLLSRAEQLRPVRGAQLAIVIDDLGPAPALTRRAIELPRPVTLAFLPYADNLASLTNSGKAHGHEIFLHLPMEPVGTSDPGPNAILVGLEPDEFRRRLSWAFERVPLATGMNNHMGSRATSEPETMLKVLREVRKRGLSFVDSRTSPMTVGGGLAAQLGIPHASRDVFLDNNPATGAILHQLALAERLARRQGHALAIGHPYPTTLQALKQWLPAAEGRGLRIVRAQDLFASKACHEVQPLQVNACVGPDCPPLPDC